MALPKLEAPVFKTTMPSTGNPIEFRPFLVKEQKILLMALEGDDKEEMVSCVKRLINSCVITDNIDPDKLPSFDLEFLFKEIRSKSVGETIEISLQINDCGKANTGICSQTTTVNLEEVKVITGEGHNKVIMLTDDVGIKMTYPTPEKMEKLSSSENTMDVVFDIVGASIESVFQGDVTSGEWDKEEMTTFLDSLNQKQFDKILNFFNTMPQLRHNIKFDCIECGKKIEYEVRGLSGFFA